MTDTTQIARPTETKTLAETFALASAAIVRAVASTEQVVQAKRVYEAAVAKTLTMQMGANR
jgi:hypothetical protein